jgi:hypothetical protein
MASGRHTTTYAVEYGKKRMVNLFLRHNGAGVNIKDKDKEGRLQ